MKEADLARQYFEYNSENDPSGTLGIAIAERVIRRAGGLDNLPIWLIKQKCRRLEAEALARTPIYQ
jgi:hypothetical protein